MLISQCDSIVNYLETERNVPRTQVSIRTSCRLWIIPQEQARRRGSLLRCQQPLVMYRVQPAKLAAIQVTQFEPILRMNGFSFTIQ
jgi:hypothetical protein